MARKQQTNKMSRRCTHAL